ncbi:hypothetical protein FRC07_009291 [Ceratobasidium sp. 392]|nr:hypothetical protein FRC07_009291 [Ceratobasidium sp. 392]
MSSPGQTQAQTTPAGSSAATGSRTTSNPGATTLPTPAPSSGAIVGGVVGGVLGLAVLALIAWLLIRKKNQQTQTPPSEKFAAPGNGPYDGGYPVQQPYNAGHYTPVPVSQGGAYNHPGHVQPYGAPDTPGAGFKPYDPSDPSTFPATPGPGAPTIHSQGATEYSNHPRPGQYNYAAEL